jgi:hypothetical protein
MHSRSNNNQSSYRKEALLLVSVTICHFGMMVLQMLLTDVTTIARFPQETSTAAVVGLPKPHVVGLPKRLEPAGTR